MPPRRPSPPAPPDSAIPRHRPGALGGPRDRNRKAKLDALYAAAEQLFLERGIEGTSVDDLTQHAGMSKGSFYRYFDDKEQLVGALLAPFGERVREALAEAASGLEALDDPEESRRVFVRLSRALFVALISRPRLTRLLLQESHAVATKARAPVHALSREVSTASIRITELALNHGLSRRAAPEVSALLVIGAVERLLLAHFNGELRTPPAEAIQGVIALVLDGMRSRHSG
jgi:AcrR family transcriptional regulator